MAVYDPKVMGKTFSLTILDILTTFVLGILLYLASLKLSRVAGGGWLEKPILMKTQSSVWTWTWTLDFDLGFVKRIVMLF